MRALLFAALMAVSFIPTARAGEMLIFETEGCYWCLRWDAEVGRYYDRSREGLAFPARRIDLREIHPTERERYGVRATPTFVLMENGREIGRFVGYSGARKFWGKYAEILETAAQLQVK